MTAECRDCHRKLRVPSPDGYGPVCRRKHQPPPQPRARGPAPPRTRPTPDTRQLALDWETDMTDPTTTRQPLTAQQLDDIEERAAAMFEHIDLGNEDAQSEAERLTGTDVPALLTEIRRLRAAVAELAQAIRLTREYVGPDLLPAVEGWSWYDALRRHAPAELPADRDAEVEAHVVAEDSDTPEHADDCHGCTTA